jgi:DNA primase
VAAAQDVRRALTDPRALCSALGIDRGARRQARGLTIACIFHPDATPSLSITIGDDGTIRYRCFGCQESGDALDLIAAVNGLDVRTQFAEVLVEAARLAGVQPPPAPEQRGRIGNVTNTATAGDEHSDRLDVASYANVAAELVALCPFVDEPDVLTYLERRRLVIQGAKAQLAALPPPEHQAELVATLVDKFGAEVLARAGLLKRTPAGKPITKWFRNPSNRLLIPWRTLDGSIALLQARRIDGEKRGKYMFPEGMRPALPFGAEALRATDVTWPIVFCEGALDVLALRSIALRDSEIDAGAGVRACDRLGIVPLGIPGLNNWATGWARFTGGRTVRIALDADAPANRHVERITADCYYAGAVRVQRWTPPEGCKDWCDALQPTGGGRS